MKYEINHETIGKIVYDENFWTGKKRIFINGKELPKISRNVFQLDEGKTVSVGGSYFIGIKLTIDKETVALGEPCKWYEYIIAFLPALFVIIWGNVAESIDIFPVVGGFVGAFVSILLGFTGLYVAHGTKKTWQKILILLGFAVLTILACWLLAMLLLNAL